MALGFKGSGGESVGEHGGENVENDGGIDNRREEPTSILQMPLLTWLICLFSLMPPTTRPTEVGSSTTHHREYRLVLSEAEATHRLSHFTDQKPFPGEGRVMAETLLSFGVEKLWNLLVRESERFQEVEEQFNGLKSDVEMLRCFLEDAEAKRHTSATVRNSIKEIKEIVLDAEDVVETFLLKKELRNTSGIRNNVRRYSSAILERRRLASDMKAISKRISKVIRDMQSLGVHVIVNQQHKQSLPEIQREMRQTFSSDNEDHLVGLEKNVEKLVGYLVEENSSQVVSIIGMGGLGKTTLARQVFNHEIVKNHFSGLAWVCVSQQFTRKYVWQTIFRQLMPEYKLLELTEEELQEKIVRVLETRKALVVIDDIWREGDWDRIKHVFVPKKEWKVLLTSRNEGVALHANKQCFTFKPEFLPFEESWHLFQKITFPMKDTAEFKVGEEMEEMGKQMIKHCGGLPLAVKVLGGLLAAQYTLQEWKRVYENIRSYIVGGTSFEENSINSVFHILYLSFEELPVYLKQCFLYIAHFPENYPLYVGDLSYYWAAEGIQRPRPYNGASIREVADGYIAELVKRNMVISERSIETSRFETCKLHDMMREVCLLKAEEENFVQIIGPSTANSKSPSTSRRLAVDRRNQNINVEAMVKNRRLRSLLFLEGSNWMESSICFTSLTLVRVLDLSEVKFEGGKLPSSIGKLIHLRYLSLYMAHLTHLPSSMGNLKQLLYLSLEVARSCEIYMPNFLKDMRELTYLYLPWAIHMKVKMELGNLVNLETLENFSIKHGRVADLQGMTRLRDLSIYIRGQGCTTEKLSSSLSKLRCLENLTIRDYNNPTNVDDDERFVLDCVNLTRLRLTIYMPTLPDEQHLSSHLTTIWLEQCYLEEDPMPVLEKLLQLKEVSLSVRSFCGRKIVCSASGFPRLRKVLLEELKYLQEWIVEEGSMPVLQTLDIEGCGKLKQLPDGLQFMTSLKDIRVGLKGEQWKKVLLEGHLPSLTTIHLSQCRLEEDPMPMLEQLLRLKEISLGKRSFCGKRIVCSGSSFPQLRTLHFYALKEWEEWIVEEGSMPLLHVVRIFFCRKLKEIPERLRNITIS